MEPTNQFNNLQTVTNNIISNLNSIRDTKNTAQLAKMMNNIGKQLNQQRLLAQDIVTSQMDTVGQTNKIDSLQTSLKKQSNLMKQLGFNGNQTTIKGLAKTQSGSNQMLAELNNTNTSWYAGFSFASSSMSVNQDYSMQTMSAHAGSSGGFKRNTTYGSTDALTLLMFKEGLAVTKMAGEQAISLGEVFTGIPILAAAGKAIKTAGEVQVKAVEAIETALRVAGEAIDLANTFADKLEEMVTANDEAIRSTIQGLGLVADKTYGTKRKADQVAKEMLLAAKYLTQVVGLPFGPDRIAEFQKAYAKLSKTSLAFHAEDYIVLAEMQKILDMSADQMAEFSKTFINMGGSVDNMSEFFVSIIDTANKSGIQAQSILDGIADVYKSSEIFKFGGSLQDMTDMMTYAKRIKVDLAGMLKLMGKVSNPSDAIDLASQLVALDTVFLGLDPIDLMGAAMTDVERFTEMITNPLRDNVDKYFDLATGQMTQYGRLFSQGFLAIDGIGNVFKSSEELMEFFAKASKEDEVRELIKSSMGVFSIYSTLSPKEQEQLIATLAAQYQSGGKITGLDGKLISQLTENDIKNILLNSDFQSGVDTKTKIEAAALGTVSVKDQIEVNKNLVESMAYAVGPINTVRDALTSVDMQAAFYLAGNAIMDAGLHAWESEFHKQFEVFKDYMGMPTDLAILYQGYFEKSIETGENTFSQAIKSVIENLWKLDPATWFGGSVIFEEKDFKHDVEYSRGGLVSRKASVPSNWISSSPKGFGGSGHNQALQKLLVSFSTNNFGPGIMLNTEGGVTNVVVSGEIRNYINDRDAGLISGDKILAVLEKQIT